MNKRESERNDHRVIEGIFGLSKKSAQEGEDQIKRRVMARRKWDLQNGSNMPECRNVDEVLNVLDTLRIKHADEIKSIIEHEPNHSEFPELDKPDQIVKAVKFIDFLYGWADKAEAA